MRIVLSGGGTGGHITPILAVADALKRRRPQLELFYIGEGGRTAKALVGGSELISRRIWAGKWRRYQDSSRLSQVLDVKTNLLNAVDFFKFNIGVVQALRHLQKIKPAAVFVKGGYVGLPVGLAARLLKLPLIIHESDAQMGLTNRLLARYATVIATGLPTRYYPDWQAKAVFTGIPTRTAGRLPTAAAGREQFKLAKQPPVILIFGGSSGSRAINQAVMANLHELLNHYQVVHISGEQHYQEIRRWLTQQHFEHKNRYKLRAFLPKQLNLAIAAADVVVARTGMSSVAEIAAAGKALITVPAPQLSDQPLNALVLNQEQAAVVLEQSRLDSQLVASIKSVIDSAKLKQQLETHLKRLAKPTAAADVAELIINEL